MVFLKILAGATTPTVTNGDVSLYMLTHMYTHTHTHVHAHMYTHTCTRTHVHAHMYTHTCTRTHVHTHMYTHTPDTDIKHIHRFIQFLTIILTLNFIKNVLLSFSWFWYRRLGPNIFISHLRTKEMTDQ